jgi:hypothetical protein
MSPFSALYELANEALLEETGRLAGNERRSTAELIAAIAEVDVRGLHLAEGCSSIFMYCTKVLHLSEHAAYDRINAARMARKFPVILARLAAGSLTLTSLTLISPYVTPDTCEELLDRVAFKTKREVEALVADLRPQLAGGQVYRLQLSVSREAWDRLLRVQALLSYSIPDGDPSRIFERAIELLLNDIEKKKFGTTASPRPSAPALAPGSRHIPAGVRREVAERDGRRCAFVGPRGRCEET